MKNNNQKILRLLAKREYQENKRRNRILIGTVAFAVWMIFCVFSLAIGKIQADYLLMVRNGGTKASTTLEDPSEEQYRKIQELAKHRTHSPIQRKRIDQDQYSKCDSCPCKYFRYII